MNTINALSPKADFCGHSFTCINGATVTILRYWKTSDMYTVQDERGNKWKMYGATCRVGVIDAVEAAKKLAETVEIETEAQNLPGNDWTPAGPYYTAMFRGMQPKGVRGCPMGRSHDSTESAVADLIRRTNSESGTTFTRESLTITKHRG